MTAVCVLYSSYSCPHSMRARLALLMANIHCELRDVDSLHLPTAVDKVPLLQLPSGKLIDDSFAIAQWSSARKPQLDLWPSVRVCQQSIENLVRIIDGPFYAAIQLYAEAIIKRDPHIKSRRTDAEIVLAQLPRCRLSTHSPKSIASGSTPRPIATCKAGCCAIANPPRGSRPCAPCRAGEPARRRSILKWAAACALWPDPQTVPRNSVSRVAITSTKLSRPLFSHRSDSVSDAAA